MQSLVEFYKTYVFLKYNKIIEIHDDLLMTL